MKVLVTGHAGFLGGAVAEYFQNQGHIVYGVSRSLKPNCSYIQYCLNVTDKESLVRLVGERGIDLIIHCAAKPIVADCATDPFGAFNTNALGTAAVLEAAMLSRVAKIIVVETDKVYGYQETIPTTEDAVLNPQSPYELSKAMSSHFCDFYRRHYNMNIISVRPVNLFGPGDTSFTRMVPNAMRSINAGRGIEVHEHAIKMYRDFIYVTDVVRMMYILATQTPKSNVYNLSSNQMMSIIEIAERITKALNHPIDPIIVGKPGEYAEIPLQSIDGSKFVSEFGFEFTPFEQAIRETYQSYKESAS
jgi:nucleoside-diphosphate-sugar epimerase